MERLDCEALGAKVASEGITVVEFGAGWCKYCLKMKDEMNLFEKAHNDIKFIYVDTNEFESAAVEYNVTFLPGLLFFKNGILVKATHGYKKFEQLEEMLKEVNEQ